MAADTPGWYYFDGQLRYKDADGWTDQCKAIEGPRATARPVTIEPADHAKAKPTRDVRRPRRRTSPLVVAVCAGLLGFGAGGGHLNPDALHGLVSWTAGKASQISALISPPAPPLQTIAAESKVKTKAKTKVKPRPSAAAKIAPVRRDANGFALDGPPAATSPANYDHPSQSDCLSFRDQVRAWSDYQNAHRPAGSAHSLPSSGEVQYLSTVCGLKY